MHNVGMGRVGRTAVAGLSLLLVVGLAGCRWRPPAASVDGEEITVGEPYHVAVTDDPEADIQGAAARFGGELERHLRANPGEWTVLEDFWRVHRCG